MQVKPVSSPHALAQGQTMSTSQYPTDAAKQARARAIEKLQGKPAPTQGNAQETPVANPNAISPEELSAIQPNTPAQDALNESSEGQEAGQVDKPTQSETQDPALRRQFQQLARQERQLRQKFQQQQQELQRQKEAFEAEKQAWASKEEDYGKNYISRSIVKDNTLQALAEAGVSYEDLTNQILNQAPPNPQMEAYVKRLESQINELKKGQDEQKKAQETAQQEQRRAAERQLQVDTTDIIRSNPVAYEAINQLGKRGIQEVVKLITETYDKDGILMSVEQAADEVENYLVEENYNMASKISKIKKRLQGTSPEKTGQSQQTQSVQSPAPMKTMTNASASTRKLSARERAISAFKGEKL